MKKQISKLSIKVPRNLLRAKGVWKPEEGRHRVFIMLNSDVASWIYTHAKGARFFHGYDMDRSTLIFNNDSELALFKLTWL